MAYVGELASGLAHEIRNPLSSMNMNLQLLAEGLEGSTPSSPVELLDRVQRIRQEVLRFAHKPELALAKEDVSEIVDEVIEFTSPQSLLSRIRIFKNYDKDIPGCHVDRDALEQALLNVLLNAEEATPDGGKHCKGEEISQNRRRCYRGGHYPRSTRTHLRCLLFDQEERFRAWTCHVQVHNR